MEAYIMKFHITRQDLIRGVQEEFNEAYPFLKIEFSKKREPLTVEEHAKIEQLLSGKERSFEITETPAPEEESNREPLIRAAAQQMLWDDFGLTDEMKVTELEILLQYQFGLPVQILRKSGHLWMETRMSRGWTLRQQNDHGEDIAGILRQKEN